MKTSQEAAAIIQRRDNDKTPNSSKINLMQSEEQVD